MIIDAPPVLPVTDAAVLTASADGALVVVSAGKTLDTHLRDALANLQAVHGHTSASSSTGWPIELRLLRRLLRAAPDASTPRRSQARSTGRTVPGRRSAETRSPFVRSIPAKRSIPTLL